VSSAIDLHIHSKNCSDGKLTLAQIFQEAKKRGLRLISITDHDAVGCQEEAQLLAKEMGLLYITGVELNISFSHPSYKNGKSTSLDLLGYGYDPHNKALIEKTAALRRFRRQRAEKILANLNEEFKRQGIPLFTEQDMKAMEDSVDGSLGRPHIASYLVKKGIVSNRQEAFDKYLVKANVPKMKVSLEEASRLIRDTGGKVILAHPNDPQGTSLVSLATDLEKQFRIIEEKMLPLIDGVECWHSRHDAETVSAYLEFAKGHGLMVTGGSDCHGEPILLGTVEVPEWVAGQFGVSFGQDLV